METTLNLGYGEACSPSARVGAAWRQLSSGARARRQAQLVSDIAALRPARQPACPAPPRWDWNPVRQQRLKLLAATY